MENSGVRTPQTICVILFVAHASYPGVRATSGPGAYREVCPGAVILYFQQLSFVWADRYYTDYSPYSIEAIVNSAPWIFVLKQQRKGIVELLDISEPSIDVTNIKVGQAYITWCGHSLDESGTRVVWICRWTKRREYLVESTLWNIT